MVPIVAIEGNYSDRVMVNGDVDLSFNSTDATLGVDGSKNPEVVEQLEALIANWERDADGDASLVVTANAEGDVFANGGSVKSYDYAVKSGVHPPDAVTVKDTSAST
jgi:enoyl-CoA hydratase/carnithine racemase